MIKTILVLLFVSTTALFAKLDVCVSIPPQAFFVKKIAGDHVHTTVLIPPGASPATYAPKPSQLKAIKKASLYFTIGVPFEKNWLARFQSINPNLRIVDMTQGIEKMPMRNPLDEAHADEEHHHTGLDPHVWLSPSLVAKMAKTVRDTLCDTDPAHAAEYESNYRHFLSEIEALKKEISEKVSSLKQRTFIVFHPSFGYFAREFGLRQIAIEKEGKEPTLHYIKRVIDFAKAHGIKTIFTEPQFSQKSARTIAKAIGGRSKASIPWPMRGIKI